MTVSTHVYTAVVLGSPNRALSVKGGSITLDDKSSPHVEASLTIAMPPAATLAALDVRMSPAPRVRITVAATVETGNQSRVFDLTLRDRDVDQAAGTVSLTLASDEALLADYGAPLNLDYIDSANSVRSVVNSVLARIGAALETSPFVDPNVNPYWSVTNLISNSSFEFDVAGWSNGSLADGLAPNNTQAFAGSKCGHWRTTGAGRSFINSDRIRVTPGREYVASAYLRHLGGASNSPRTGGILLRWFDARGTALLDEYSPLVSVQAINWARSIITRTAPDAAVEVSIHPFFDTDLGDRYAAVDAVMFHEGNRSVPFFDGLTPDDARYSYVYSDEILQQGTSTRVPVMERDRDALVWTVGTPAIDYLTPIVQSVGLRLVCDESRKWTLRDENYLAAGTTAIRHGVNLIDGTDKVSRDDETWFDAAVTIYTWNTREGITKTKADKYLPTGWTRMRKFEKAVPYPGPGFSEYAVRRAQGRGREVSATAVSDWRARPEQNVTVVLDGAPIQTGRTSRVTFNLDRDEMTVTTRSLDTPSNAIDLLAGTINAQTRTIDNL